MGTAPATEIILVYHPTFQSRRLSGNALTGDRHSEITEHAKGVKIWAREGRVNHCRGLSSDVLFEHFHLRKTSTLLSFQHAQITKPIYTQNSEEPVYRKPTPPTDHVPDPPANKLSPDERTQILKVLNSPRFVDLAPMQVYTKLLDEGIYIGSVSTLYRVLAENQQVKERRRLATHPPRAIPELVATAPNQLLTWDITRLAGPVKWHILRLLSDAGHLFPTHRWRPCPHHRIRGLGR